MNLTPAGGQAFEFGIDLLLTGDEIPVLACVFFDFSELTVYVLKLFVGSIDFLAASPIEKQLLSLGPD